MIEAIASLFESILEGVGRRRRLVAALLAIGAGIGILLFIESHSRILLLFSLHQKAILLEEMNRLSQEGIEQRTELVPIYQSLAREIESARIQAVETPDLTTLLLKLLSGASLGLIFGFLAFVTRRRRALRGAIGVASVFGLVALVIPVMGNIAVNFVLLFLGQVMLLSLVGGRKSSSDTTRPA